ncbi:hypothetical protein SDC9_181278 [bioreactor metagenome]|uniref:Uncharacterized protein n=1 Tax=bioreactor metagenome TaxID=1076179 RepID=A0A645H5M6_9ZZZZ
MAPFLEQVGQRQAIEHAAHHELHGTPVAHPGLQMLHRRAHGEQVGRLVQGLMGTGQGLDALCQHGRQTLGQALAVARHQLACRAGAAQLQTDHEVGGDDEDQHHGHQQRGRHQQADHGAVDAGMCRGMNALARIGHQAGEIEHGRAAA